MKEKSNHITFKGIFIWFVAMLFYFYECFLRVYPNTIADDLMTSLHVNAEGFSLLSSSYFIVYAFMQILVGFFLYRFGARRILTMACFACSLGVLWFSFADTLYSAIFGRIFMGFGSAFAFISILSLSLNWFPAKHFGFFSGLSQFLGSIGPLCAGAPLAMLLIKFNNNWHQIFFLLGILGLIFAFLILLFVRNKPKSEGSLVYLEFSKNFKESLFPLMRSVQVWMIILYAGFIYAAMPVLGSYWGTLYLQTRNFDKSTAAFITSLIWIGLAIGCPIIGKISDMMKRRVPCMIVTACLGIIMSLCMLFVPTQNKYLIMVFFIGIGLASSGQILSFATIAENTTKKLQTTLMGFNNMALMLFGAIIPSFIGAIIHTHMHKIDEVVPYKTHDFIRGLTLMPFLYVIAFLIAVFGIRETFCRSRFEMHHLQPQDEK